MRSPPTCQVALDKFNLSYGILALGSGDLVADPLTGHLALDRRESQQPVASWSAHTCGGVEPRGDRNEAGLGFGGTIHELGKVSKVAGQPVNLVN